jgi:hypothetical protein
MGLYLQWLGSLLANAFLPDERRSMAGAYAGFAVALLVALLLLIFQSDCAFTAEMIVLLTTLWGGSYIVLLPFIQWKRGERRGLELMLLPVFLPLVPISAWFWIRIAAAGEVDFNPTPSGTSFFLIYHVQPSGLGKASIFMASLCLWLTSTPVFGLITFVLQLTQKPLLVKYTLYILVFSPMFVIALILQLTPRLVSYTIEYLGIRVASWFHRSDSFMQWVQKPQREQEIREWYVPGTACSLSPSIIVFLGL